MAERRFSIGDKALVSRDESGENHEEATVVDSYVLLIGEESRPMVVVDFADGERKWMTASEENVLPIEPEPVEGEDEAGDPAVEADGAADDPELEAGLDEEQ